MVFFSYNFVMSISRFFDDYEVKKICVRKFLIIFLYCSKICEYLGFFRFLKNNLFFFRFLYLSLDCGR